MSKVTDRVKSAADTKQDTCCVENTRRGWVVVAASVVMQMCLGGIYAWSMFVNPLRDDYKLTTTQTQIIFGVIIAAFTIAMVFAGRLQEIRSPRLVASIGALMFGIGWILASFSGGSFPVILLGIGIIGGVGIGFCYVCPLATCVKWFPHLKGFVTGLAVAGFGGGGVLLSFVAGYLIENGNNVLEVFRTIGLVYGVILLVCAAILCVPKGLSKGERANVLFGQVFRESRFWSLVVGMFCGTFAGLMVIGNIKPIGTSVGLSPEQAGVAVAALAVGNAVGRICWGFVYDRIGWVAIPLSLTALCAAVIMLLPSAGSGSVFSLASAFVGFGFGACFVVYAAQIASYYGHSAVGNLYPIVFLAYGLSGILGPTVGGLLFDKTGSYLSAMIVSAVMIISGVTVITIIARRGTCEVPVLVE